MSIDGTLPVANASSAIAQEALVSGLPQERITDTSVVIASSTCSCVSPEMDWSATYFFRALRLSARTNFFATDCGIPAFLAKDLLCAAACMKRRCLGDFEGTYRSPGFGSPGLG